jgi:uncharacterized protein YcfJ
MKKTIYILLIATTAMAAKAQLFSNESLTGALLGGIAGGVIVHNHHRQGGEGAAIGAGAGLLLGTIVHNEKEKARYQAPVTEAPVYAPTYTTTYVQRPNNAVGGAVLGGIAGAVIGHNHHRQGAEGAAIGAASGLVLEH